MADPRGFLKHGRESTPYREVDERLGDWKLVQEHFPLEKTQEQASRCMDCGIPFCNNGCPLGNIIPDFNDLVFRNKWEDALARLHEAGLGHGDIRAENVLVVDGNPYFIDATALRESRAADARAYDLACALSVLERKIGAREAVDIAMARYTVPDLLAAREFVGFINIRPDHDFDGALLRGEIEKRAT